MAIVSQFTCRSRGKGPRFLTSPDLLGDAHCLSDSIPPKYESPAGQTIRPSLRNVPPSIVRRGIRRAALRDERLLDEPTGLIPSDFPIEYMGQTSFRVLVDCLQAILEVTPSSRMRHSNVIVRRIRGNITLFHGVDDCFDVLCFHARSLYLRRLMRMSPALATHNVGNSRLRYAVYSGHL
jgi:hypothetical protein